MKTKLFSVLALLPALVFAQYSNGALSTGATSKSGTAAPAGYTWSELQNDTGNTTESNTNLGYSAMRSSTTASYFLADDFVVPAGETWQISTVEVFSYQTNYAGTTSPFNTIRINIYNGDPSTTGTSVFGDDTTNRFAGSVDAMMYRIGNTAVPAAGVTNTARKLWKTTGNVNASMPAGTYWLKYQLENITLASGGFSPPVTIVGSRTQPGFNAKQFD